MKTILFQGDSITDAWRDRNNDDNRGLGYPHLVSAHLGCENPGAYTFINRGVSGDRSVDLYARIKRDCLVLKPDYMSVLIGVNDVWHELGEVPNGIGEEKFEKMMTMFFEEIFAEQPDMKIFILEPFVLHGTATDPHWDCFSTEVPKRAAAMKRIAEKFGMKYVTLQDKFDAATKLAPPEYWTADGVHPTPFGHQLIAKAWLEAFEEMK